MIYDIAAMGLLAPGKVVLVLVAFGLVLLYVRRYRYSEFTVHDTIGHCRPIDCSGVADTLHPLQDTHLSETLSPNRFRHVQGKRIGQSLELVGRVARNARYLRYFGSYELRRSLRGSYRQSRFVSRQLLMAALYCQVVELSIRVKLYCWLIRMAFLPFIGPPNFAALARSGNMMYLYERSKRAALILASNYGPDVRARLAAVL